MGRIGTGMKMKCEFSNRAFILEQFVEVGLIIRGYGAISDFCRVVTVEFWCGCRFDPLEHTPNCQYLASISIPAQIPSYVHDST